MWKEARVHRPLVPVAGLLALAALAGAPASAQAASAPQDAVQVAPAPVPASPAAPVVRARFDGLRLLGAPLYLEGSVAPAAAGRLVVALPGGRRTVRVAADGRFRVRLASRRAGRLCTTLTLEPAAGGEPVSRSQCTTIRAPRRALGSRGDSVRYLEERLAKRHYVLARVDGVYRDDTRDAVLAFQKVEGLPRDGVATRRVWRALLRARTPRPRWSGTYLEVDKRRQILLEVRGGRVTHVSHASTGATGNTPVGRWRIYRKDAGFNSIGMYYSLYFLRGFATHGYVSVPTYPASHGCVRLPLWYAPRMYARWHLGDTVRVHAGASRARATASPAVGAAPA